MAVVSDERHHPRCPSSGIASREPRDPPDGLYPMLGTRWEHWPNGPGRLVDMTFIDAAAVVDSDPSGLELVVGGHAASVSARGPPRTARPTLIPTYMTSFGR